MALPLAVSLILFPFTLPLLISPSHVGFYLFPEPSKLACLCGDSCHSLCLGCPSSLSSHGWILLNTWAQLSWFP